MLPSCSGFDVCRFIRQRGNTIPILILTALGSESDRVDGLESGADDYLIKPFSMRELIARIRALLRRNALVTAPAPAADTREALVPALASAPRLIMEPEKREAYLQNKLLALSRKEFDLLLLLASHPGHVFHRQALLDHVWRENRQVDHRTIDVLHPPG